jgi:hypothetical protein
MKSARRQLRCDFQYQTVLIHVWRSVSGWSDCPSAGEPIARLIPSKVPLGESFNELLEPGKRYSRAHVVRHQQALGRKVVPYCCCCRLNQHI